ncbi:MAG: hypothetical protein WBM62_10880 [Crocosphaera sp.]
MAEHLNISRRSVQRFLKKFKHFNLIEYELNRFKYKTTAGSPHQEEATPGSPKRHQDRQNDPRIAKTTPGSPKRHQDRFGSPECPSDNDPSPSQTLQTNQTSQTIQMGVEGVENSGSDPDLDLVNKKIEDYEQNYSQQEEVKQEKQINPKDPKQDRSSATVVQDTTKRCTNQPTVIQNTTKRCTKSEEIVETLHATSVQKVEVSSNGHASNVCKIPQDLINKLEELHIPLDEKVCKAIADHHISQAYGAMRHVENTWESVNNPRSVFLHQLPLQRIQKGPKPLSEEFLQWYQWAIADGLVVDRLPEHLPKNFRGEPRVTLVIDHYWLEDWEKVRDNPDDYRQKIDPNLHKKLLAQVKNVFKKMPDAEPEFTLNDKLKDHILGPEVYQQIKRTHNVEFTEEGSPYAATEIIEIEYDEDGFPVDEVKQC